MQGEARRSIPLTASETPVSSMVSGGLLLSEGGPRARPAARPSPPSWAGLGLAGAAGLGTGIDPVPHETTRTQKEPQWQQCQDKCDNNCGVQPPFAIASVVGIKISA